MNKKEEYKLLLEKYRRQLFKLRKAEREGSDSAEIISIDNERNAIHNKLRKIAPDIGLTSQDITLDILVSDKDLSGYGLPEFKVLRTNTAMDRDFYVSVDKGESTAHWAKGRVPDNMAAFIPFGQLEDWHLFDREGYNSHEPDELERCRRLAKLIELSKEYASAIKIVSPRSFHVCTTLYGVGLPIDKIDEILLLIKEFRSEVSISKEFFNEQQICRDFIEIIQTDVDYIINRKPDETESRFYLVDRLADHINNHSIKNLTKETVEKINKLLEDSRERARIADEREKIERDMSKEMDRLDHIDIEFPKESNMPMTGRGKKK